MRTGAITDLDEDPASPSYELLREIACLDEAPPRHADLVGARLGHFQVVELLGRGGMGVVYRAEDEALRRDVALKVLPQRFADDEERRRRFLREARSAAAVNHPCIATVHEVGEAEGRIYIAMELVRGRTLAAILAERRLAVPEALRIAGRILDGIGKAHEAGLVHRDLKPDNVMLTDEGALKVLDFGLAKPQERATPAGAPALAKAVAGPREQATSEGAPALAETLTRGTAHGRIVGTPSYMSPEQARGDAVDPRSDVFSFGVMLYEMLTGRRPFVGSTSQDVMTAIQRDDPAPVSALNPEVSLALSRIVQRCLAKDVGERYADCRSLAGDLDRALGAGVSAPATSQPPSPPRPPRSLLRAGMALPLVLGLGGLVIHEIVDHLPSAPGAPPIVGLSRGGSALAPGAPPAPALAPADERAVRLAIEPADATVEVDGRATPVEDGGVELRGVLGSAYHVRLVKGSRETAGEVAITSLGAVPPRMQVEATAPRPLLVKPSGGKADAARGPWGTSVRDAGKDPALDGQFE